MNRTVNYDYDPVGNRQRVADNGQITGYTANNLNQYTVVDGSTLSYDANGNLSNTVAGVLGDWSYTYDAQNRLIRAVGGPSSIVAEFYYDARDRCVKQVINGLTTYLIYDGWSLLEERNLAGNLLARYYHGPVIDELLCRVTETNTVYYHHDGLGSTIALTDSTGNVVESYTYDVYGQPMFWNSAFSLQPSSLQSNRFLFTGREYLADLALYDYRHRFYSPVLGRFLQIDPMRFEAGDENLYRYVGNSTSSSNDAFGLTNEPGTFGWNNYSTGKGWAQPGPGDFRYYGNWGGPGWTGGRWTPEGHQYENMTPEERKTLLPPIDKQDECYKKHDICYSNCRVEFRDCPQKLKDCFTRCDRELAAGLAALGKDPSNNFRAKIAKPYFRHSHPTP